MIFKLGEMFCGPGGLALGALKASAKSATGEVFKIEHCWANDIDPSTCETYQKNICPDQPDSVIQGDARKIIDLIPGDFDAFAFGFPCNDFSLIGPRRSTDGDYGKLYKAGLNVLIKFKPKWFIAENVTGLVSAKNDAFITIMQALADAGYNLFPHLYEFEKYCVPQTRHRIIIVGINRQLYPDLTFKIPAPLINEPKQMITCREALANIPADAPNNERPRHGPKVIERLLYIKPGENAFTAKMPPEIALKSTKKTFSLIYRRLEPDQPAYTVIGSGGGGTQMYHWAEPRGLTNRERARLQTFPDDYVFCGNTISVRRQIGMAVPCRGAEVIFNAILSTFAGLPYPAVEQNIKFCNASNAITDRE